MGGTFENVDCSAEGMPGTQGGDLALDRETRIVGYSDGGQGEYAKSRSWRFSEAFLPGVERAGGAEDKRSIEARKTLAQVGKMGR